MSDKELAIKKVLMLGKPTLIECSNEKVQESTRVILYHLKKKMCKKGEAETLGITKFSYGNQLFIKVFKRPVQRLYELNDLGIPVLIKAKPEDDQDLQRQIKLMRKDGRSEEEIQRVISDWERNQGEEEVEGEVEKEKKVESLEPNPELRGIDPKNEGVLTEKEEMKRMMEEGEREK